MSFRAKFELGKTNPWNLIIGLVVLFAVVYGIFKLTQWIFTLLYYLAPLLLVATLLIDINVVKGYIRSLGNLLKRNTPLGVGAVALSLIFIPIPVTYLFIKALMKRQAKQQADVQRRIEEGDLVDFEELESRPLEKREIPMRDEDTV